MMNRRRMLAVAGVGALASLLASCESGGHFTVLGYTTRPNYDTCIKTVHVPIFANKTLRRNLEIDLTRAVIREIESKTPYKVVASKERADTELSGCIMSFNKQLLNRNQFNEIREAETVLGVLIVWRDLRTGEILSQQRSPTATPVIPGLPAPDALPEGATLLPDGNIALPSPDPAVNAERPIMVASTATFIPEIGQSITTAQQQNFNRLAVSIVSLMEKPW